MSLQDIFKQFYSKAKTVDLKQQAGVNSAMNSLNGFSAKLEARRKAAREAKESKNKEETDAEETTSKDEEIKEGEKMKFTK